MQEEHVVHQALGVRTEPETERRGHGYLQMGVAGHEHLLVGLALLLQRVEKAFGQPGNFLQAVTCEQLQVEQHLVVPRTSAVNLLAYIAQPTCQHQFHLRMYILDAFLYDKLAAFRQFIDAPQLMQQQVQLFGSQQTDAFEHGDVCHRTDDVILCQIKVQLPIAPHGEAFDLLVHFEIFLPEFHVREKVKGYKFRTSST